MAPTKGIGRLLDLALTALETDHYPEMDPKLWAYEARGNMGAVAPGLPKPGRIGSSNFGPVANVCELVRSKGSDKRARGWLADFYRRQGPSGDLGHCLYEPLSATYEEAHEVSALIAYSLGIKEAGAWLERELALGLLHRCPNGRIVAASTRAGKNPKHWALEDFCDLALTERLVNAPRNSLIRRAFALEGGWRAPAVLRTLQEEPRPYGAREMREQLDTIRFASGPLVVTHYENGHVSRFETGPLCYASPAPAAVVRYEPFEVWYASFPGKTAAPFKDIATRYDPELQALICAHAVKSDAFRIMDLSDLGAVVAGHRFKMVGE